MDNKQVELLKRQIQKLHNENFDLEAWKSATIAVLTRIFGSSDPKIGQIHGLKIDYGSWALRDAQGSYNPLETCKKKGEELLSATIDELEILGMPEAEKSVSTEELISILEDEFKVSQLKSIKSILSGSKNEEEKLTEIIKVLKKSSKDANEQILGNIIMLMKEGFE